VSSYPALPGSSISSVFVDRRDRVFACAGSNGVYMSTDGGSSWIPDTAGMGKRQVLNLGDDAFGNIYAPSGNALFQSPGGTQPWARIDGALISLTGTGVGFSGVKGDSVIEAATNFGLFSSTNHGATWADESQGLSADNITGLVHLSSGRFLVGGPRGIYSRNANDTSWTKSYPQGVYRSGLGLTSDAAGNIYTIDPSFPGPNGGYGYSIKSTDAGATWNLDTAGVSKLFVGGISSGIYYVDETGGQHTSVWPGTSSWFPYSKASGGSWTVDSLGMHISPSSGDGQLAIVGDDNGILYCSNAITGMFKRSVSGTVWASDTAGLGSAVITRLCKGINGDIYGSALGGKYYVRRGGVWSTLNPPSGPVIGFTSAISVDRKGDFFIAVRGGFPDMGEGVYFTHNDGKTWTKAGLDTLTVSKMVSYDDSTYVLTNNRGVYILNVTGITGIKTEIVTPSAFVLMQNYPNPFNPVTAIRYGVPRRSNVKLAVFNTLGQQVAVLVNESQEAGLHEVKFDGSNMASGVYFYRIQAGEYTEAKKFVLLR
jgi:hypothetical protein